jgi:alanyl-tRNA synthetase
MGKAYPELVNRRAFVEEALRAEEQRFGETLEQGMKLFEDVVARATTGTIAGDDAFRLYDTYGFPVDLTADIARERGLAVDMAGFERAMDAQRERARAASRFEARAPMPAELASQLVPTVFLGYDLLDSEGSTVVGIVRDGRSVDQLASDEQGVVILDRTPFYAESGGQVGDSGELRNAAGRLAVDDTVKMGGVFFAHAGRWLGAQPLRTGDTVAAQVDAERRQAIVLNHSATHLLHAALRRVLGTHVAQKGSLVAPERLRFDFSHAQPVTADELRRVEDAVNAEIRRNVVAEVHEMAYPEALEFGALALFGEKYGDRVRVLRMGGFSTELCGGTHVQRSGDIGLFKIVAESGVAAGVRRIEALTGAGALAFVDAEEQRLGQVAHLLSARGDDMVDKLKQLFERQKTLERELQALKGKAVSAASADLAGAAVDVAGIKVVAARLPGLDPRALRDSVDRLKQQLGDCVVLLAAAAGGKVALVAGVHGAATGRIKAGDVVAHVAAQIDGKGGGRADMAQGGGVDSPALDRALNELPAWLGGLLH